MKSGLELKNGGTPSGIREKKREKKGRRKEIVRCEKDKKKSRIIRKENEKIRGTSGGKKNVGEEEKKGGRARTMKARERDEN